MNLQYYLALATIALGTIGGVYFFIQWLVRGRQNNSLLLWTIGYFLLFWFQIPLVKANSGDSFTFTEFNLFLAIVFPLSILGLLLIYGGIKSVQHAFTRKNLFLIIGFFVFSIAAFGVDFIVHGGVLQNYIFLFVTVFLIHTPVELLIAWAAWKYSASWLGGQVMMFGALFGSLQDFLTFNRVLYFPPSLWFGALMSYTPLFAVQIASALLLLTGGLIICQSSVVRPHN